MLDNIATCKAYETLLNSHLMAISYTLLSFNSLLQVLDESSKIYLRLDMTKGHKFAIKFSLRSNINTCINVSGSY